MKNREGGDRGSYYKEIWDTTLYLDLSKELLAKVRNLPFDKLRVNGLRLKLFSFSVRGELVEPQKNTFARGSKGKTFNVYYF